MDGSPEMPASYQLPRVALRRVLLYLLLVTTINSEKADPQQTFKTCGSGTNPNGNHIDLREPEDPHMFHDLTTSELRKLRQFLEKDNAIRASSEFPPRLNSSYIHAADLLVPPKAEALALLDLHTVTRPIRKARVVLSRGDKNPPVFEEYVCWPIPDVTRCTLLKWRSRRNPVPFAIRPSGGIDHDMVITHVFPEVDRRVGYILQESYGRSFSNCTQPSDCLSFQPSMVGTGLIEEAVRLTWYIAAYNLPYPSNHMLDFAFCVDTSSPDYSQWSVVRLWYGNVVYDSFHDLINSYDCGRINKTRVTPPANDEKLFSSLKQRGPFQPPKAQRPPTLVEPDGKRYSVKERKVTYFDWVFAFRLSALTGPVVYDVRFKKQRIVYELGLNEMSVFYSGMSTNYVDSGEYLGINSRSLVPGGDCPETATLINSTFMSFTTREPEVYKASMCLFEQNNGYPLRRHLGYRSFEGSFYGGMLDSALTLRSALTIGNYDYIVDFIFHQNGIIETRFMSTGYIQTLFYATRQRPYGFNIHENQLGNIHHHLAHFKVDLDVSGTSNRYETLDISEEKVELTGFPGRGYSQTRIDARLKKTELEAVYDFNFNTPKYHVVHNNAVKTDKGEIKAYRIQMHGGSKQLVAENFGNDKTVSWARHQMVVTKHKDDELSSSSIYGMYDSLLPTVNFKAFYADDERIVDEDLVFWITAGLHHIPHAEEFPVTSTVGNHLTFFLRPFNFFPECPSVGSRDAIYVDHKDPANPKQGVKVERNGNSREQCVIPRSTLEEDLARDPNQILET